MRSGCRPWRNRLELTLGASLLLVFVAMIFILASRLVQRAIDVNWTSVTNLMATYQLELWIAVGVFLAVMDAAGAFVNVSDGGHLENLGLCELLRRRCRRIIVVDATVAFACLAAAIRYARIDLGIEIAIDLDALRLRGDVSTRHWALGDVDYGRGERGQLIFLKSSLTGDEVEAILEYKRESPTFPQESSSNQFFSEAQFEAYRALGEHIARGILDSGELQWA